MVKLSISKRQAVLGALGATALVIGIAFAVSPSKKKKQPGRKEISKVVKK